MKQGDRVERKNVVLGVGQTWICDRIAVWPWANYPFWACFFVNRTGIKEHVSPFNFMQAYLGDIAGSVLDYCTKVSIAVKQVKWIFGFPVHVKLCLHYTTVWSVQLSITSRKTTHTP